MSDNAKTKRRTTIAFRGFKKKTSVLSDMYWTSEAGRQAVRTLLALADPDAKAATELGVLFDARHLNETVREFLKLSDERAGSERLNLLVMCSANLESFLQDAIEIYVANLGHRNERCRLDVIGEQIAKPVVGRSSIPPMLKYVESLIGVRFGGDYNKWQRGYKLRCIAAHEAGLLSSENQKKLKTKKQHVGDWIRLSWEELKSYLESAYSIADRIDEAISSKSLLLLEVEWTLARWKREGSLPPRDQIWTAMNELGVSIGKEHRKEIENRHL